MRSQMRKKDKGGGLQREWAGEEEVASQEEIVNKDSWIIITRPPGSAWLTVCGIAADTKTL